jgi:general secretion pathway protein A
MYKEFYGLTQRPFDLLPNPEFLYLSQQHKLARAYLEYGISQRLGFVVLTGEIGTGKTTLIKALLKAQERSQRIGVLYQSLFGAEDMLELLLAEFGVRGRFDSRVARLGAFNHFLRTAYAHGEQVVLIIDEAQNLGPEALEEIRLLSNLDEEKEPLLQVILVGQPGLRKRLRHPALEQLAQRVGVHFHLIPLDLEETKEYILFRLARAGGSGIFTDSALNRLFDYSQGVPRRINSWCDLALVAGFAEGVKEIDDAFIDMVARAQEMSLEGPETEAETFEEPLVKSAAESPSLPGGNNHLRRELGEVVGRLTRLEGLVMEMTSQLMPALNLILSRSSLPEPSRPAAADAGEESLFPVTAPLANEPASLFSRWRKKIWEGLEK